MSSIESFAEGGDARRASPSPAHGRKDRPEEILGALSDLDHALAGHTEWLKNWHLRFLNTMGVATSEDDGDPPRCHFMDWLRDQPHTVFADNPRLREVWEVGAAMREKARALLGVIRDKELIPADEYGHFMNTVLEFNTQVRQLQNDTWNRLANIDPLTGIGNRKAMIRELDRERDRFLRSNRPSCIAVADLDHFKRVNDTHGHPVGDRVLVAIAECFSRQLRPYDSVHRYGGEEFLFCLPDTDLRTAAGVADRLRRAAAAVRTPLAGDETVTVSVSFGVAQMDARLTLEETIGLADAALYRAKAAGRDRVETS